MHEIRSLDEFQRSVYLFILFFSLLFTFNISSSSSSPDYYCYIFFLMFYFLDCVSFRRQTHSSMKLFFHSVMQHVCVCAFVDSKNIFFFSIRKIGFSYREIFRWVIVFLIKIGEFSERKYFGLLETQ